LAELAVHALDVVITDAPVPAGSPVRAYSHLLGESAVTLFAQKTRAERLRRHFPRSLEGVPMLLPTEGTSLRRQLAAWMEGERVRPRIAGEFQDGALVETCGRPGMGVLPGAPVLAAPIC